MKRGRKSTTDFVVYARRILERKKLKSKRTYIGAELHIRKLCEYFADRKLEDVTEDAWVDYCVWRRTRNPSCRLFDDRKHLTSILFAAYREGLLDRRPQLAVLDEKRDVGREITPEELGRIYQYANPTLTLQIDICLLMGLRLREMLGLRWDAIDWEKGLIRLKPSETKTRKGRVVPIHRELVDRLRARRSNGSAYLFPGRDPHPHGTERVRPRTGDRPQTTNALTWRRCLRKAGVKARWHDLRHTCASRMLRRGTSPHVAAAVLGMGIKVLIGIYAHQNIDDLRRAVEG